MFKSIEMQLTKARSMAERADEPMLLYLIDVAIIEAKALSSNNSLEALIPRSLERRPRSQRVESVRHGGSMSRDVKRPEPLSSRPRLSESGE